MSTADFRIINSQVFKFPVELSLVVVVFVFSISMLAQVAITGHQKKFEE